MPNNIFINYRKDDSLWNTQSLYNELLKYFPKKAIFKDINAIDPGSNYVGAINKALEKCHTLIVVIGKGWLDMKNENGNRRLDDPEDFVRIEIATAIKRNIKIIPLLFDNVKMPDENSLPTDLKPLVYFQLVTVTVSTFESDIEKLSESIKRRIINYPKWLIKLLKLRIFIIPFLITFLSLILNKVINFTDLQSQFLGVTLIVSFSIMWVISFYLKNKNRSIDKSKMQIISLVLIAGFILSLSFHLYNYYERTYTFKGEDGLTLHAVKGKELTKDGRVYRNSLPSSIEDYEIIREKLGGNPAYYWEPSSILSNKLIIFSVFGLMIITLSFLIALRVEVMANNIELMTNTAS